MPIGARREILRTIGWLELLVEWVHSLLPKRPVRESRGFLFCQIVYCIWLPYLLYNLAQAVWKLEASSFDFFLPWGPMLTKKNMVWRYRGYVASHKLRLDPYRGFREVWVNWRWTDSSSSGTVKYSYKMHVTSILAMLYVQDFINGGMTARCSTYQ